MRKIIAGAVLALLATFYLAPTWSPSAIAQSVMCPTRPVGDSTNACASTAFVQSQSFVTPGGIPSTSIIIGTTVVTPSNSNAYLYNNSGVVGERTGTTTQVLHGGSGGFTQIVNADITPAAGINLSKLESVAANTYLGAVTPAGAPSAQTLSTCSLLNYTANTGFGCAAQAFTAVPAVNGLSLANNTVTPNSYVDISADTMVLLNPSGPANIFHSAYTCTVNSTTTGVGALDTGSVAANTWYAVYAISNGSSTSCLLSTSFTSPTLPGGYVYLYRIGSIKTDGSSNFYRIKQYGRRIQYVVVGGTNTNTYPIIATNTTVVTAAAYSVTPYVPTTAATIILMTSSDTGNAANIVAPNNQYNNVQSNPAILVIGGAIDQIPNIGGEFLLESTNIYAQIGSGTQRIWAIGWTDRINAN